ncbi:hypothetical protein pipiens_000736, partial [Culex pipiens pipiens]
RKVVRQIASFCDLCARTCEERQRGHKFTCLRRLPSSADGIAGQATTLWPAAAPSTSWQKTPGRTATS